MKKFAKIIVPAIVLISVVVVHHHHRQEVARRQAVELFIRFVHEEMPKLMEEEKRVSVSELANLPFPTAFKPKNGPSNRAFTQ